MINTVLTTKNSNDYGTIKAIISGQQPNFNDDVPG